MISSEVLDLGDTPAPFIYTPANRADAQRDLLAGILGVHSLDEIDPDEMADNEAISKLSITELETQSLTLELTAEASEVAAELLKDQIEAALAVHREEIAANADLAKLTAALYRRMSSGELALKFDLPFPHWCRGVIDGMLIDRVVSLRANCGGVRALRLHEDRCSLIAKADRLRRKAERFRLAADKRMSEVEKSGVTLEEHLATEQGKADNSTERKCSKAKQQGPILIKAADIAARHAARKARDKALRPKETPAAKRRRLYEERMAKPV